MAVCLPLPGVPLLLPRLPRSRVPEDKQGMADEDDRARGYIQSTDREGNMRTFPLMAISIAVVFNVNGRLKHYGEASQIAMTLKKKAKENPKSSYVLDKRMS